MHVPPQRPHCERPCPVSGDKRGFLGFVESFVAAFTRSSRSQSARTTTSAPRPRPTAGGSWLRDDSRTGTSVDSSPGQFGSDATRDLTDAEIRSLRPSYQPAPDGDPDPGEVVWTWVPYAENDGRGKDRPVLIIARIDSGATAGCYLSTKQHRGFVSVGSGDWDPQGRPSFLAPDRLLRVTDSGMRREGHVLPEGQFNDAVDAVAQLHRLQW